MLKMQVTAVIYDTEVDPSTKALKLQVRLHDTARTKASFTIAEVIAMVEDEQHAALENCQPYKLYCHLSSMWFLSTLYFMQDLQDVLASLSLKLQRGHLTINDYVHHTEEAVERLKAMESVNRAHTRKFLEALDRDKSMYCGLVVGGMEEEQAFLADKGVAHSLNVHVAHPLTRSPTHPSTHAPAHSSTHPLTHCVHGSQMWL